MRKFSYLLSLLVLSLVCGGTAWAQIGDGKLWHATTLVTSLDQIVPGEDYALQGPGVGGNTSSTYLQFGNSSGSGELTGDCIYQFVEAGTLENMPAYYLVQKSTGLYLSSESVAGTDDEDEAFHFNLGLAHNDTLRRTDAFFFSPKDGSDLSQMDPMFSLVHINDASADDYTYLTSWSAGHNFMGYHDTGVWKIWTDIEEVRGSQRLQTWLSKLLPGGPEEAFSAGVNPGDVEVSAYEKLVDVYNRVAEGIGGGLLTDDEADALCDEMLEAYQACQTTLVMPEAGKYYILTGNKGRANGSNKATVYCEPGGEWHWKYAAQPVTDLSCAIQLRAGSTDGTFHIYDPFSDRYMGAINGNSNTLLSVDSVSAADYIIGHSGGQYFYLTNEGISQGLHAQEAGNAVVGWNYNSDASQWTFQTLSAEDSIQIDELAKQSRLNIALNDLYDEASDTYMAGRAYTSAATADTLYASHGLLTSTDQIFTSPLASGDGNGIDILLNGRLTGSGEYMHTTWSSGNAPNHYHFVGADLKKAVNAITVKFSNRIDGAVRKSYPKKFRVYACNDAKVAADTVADGASWKWVGDMSATLANDTIADTWVASIDLGDAYQFVRLDVIETGNNSTIAPSGGSAYPFFYISELGIYEATYDPANSPYESVPEADGQALADALADARKEIEVEKATQPTIDQLQSAYDKFLESYADPQVAIDAIAEAQEMLDSAEVGTGLGQVTQAPYDALKQAITDSEAKIKTVMQLTDIQAIVDDLQAKRDALAASAVMPATGKYYWIISKGPGKLNAAIGAANNADGAALLQGAVIEVEGMPNTFDEATAQTNYEYVWYLGQDADGTQYLRNVATGYYMNGNTTSDMTTTKEKAPIKVSYAKAGVVAVQVLFNDSTESGYIYLNNNANDVTKYFIDNNSCYDFKEVDFGDVPANYVSVDEGWHFLCLPYAIMDGASNSDTYKILGINSDNELVLQSEYNFAPGEPFVYYLEPAKEGEEAITSDDFGVDLTQDLVSEGSLLNGVQGILSGISVEAGYGVLAGSDTIEVTTGTRAVGNNSAYVVKTATLTDAEGDYVLPINGELTGTSTGIDKVVIVPKDGKIYDLQGRRVSRPGKGIYIVNGKKMIFK